MQIIGAGRKYMGRPNDMHPSVVVSIADMYIGVVDKRFNNSLVCIILTTRAIEL